ncbi:MAG TPA: hypothetical protein VFY97_06460 [Rhodanobacteraceae bacterium]|nr:hypothetical protein [Rhodanobacteraceae bacterium]
MDAFSYLSVLISIIIGLAVTQVLQGFRGLILARSRLHAYWPSVVWGVLLLLIDVQAWWAMYDLRYYQYHHAWSFLGFAVVLSETVPLYLLAGLVFPDVSVEGEVDLRTHYFENHRWFFVLAMLLMVTSVLKTVVLYGNLPPRADTLFQALFFVTCAIAAWTRREWYHRLVAITSALGFAAYVGTLFMQLR